MWYCLYSCSADGFSVDTQDNIAPERDSQFAKQTPNLEETSLVMTNPQQTSEPNEGEVHVVQIENIALVSLVLPQMIETWNLDSDPAEKPEYLSPVKASNLDHDEENISREDKLLSSEVDLHERKQDEDLLYPVPLLSSTQTSAPKVLMDGTDERETEPNGKFLDF